MKKQNNYEKNNKTSKTTINLIKKNHIIDKKRLSFLIAVIIIF